MKYYLTYVTIYVAPIFSRLFINSNLNPYDPYEYYMDKFDEVKIPISLTNNFYKYYYQRIINSSIKMNKYEITQAVNNLLCYVKYNIKSDYCLKRPLQ